MKKHLFIIALAATVLAGCQKEDFSAPEAKKEGGKTVLTAVVDGTRSTVSEDGMFAWAQDDVIGAMTPEGKFAQFNLTGGSGTYSATFNSVDDNVKVEKVAVFPYNMAKSLEGKKLTLSLPSSFAYVPERTNSPMVAVISGDDASHLSFKHLGGLLTVTFAHVPADSRYLYVNSTTNTVWGNFVVEDYTAEGACIQTGPIPSGSTRSAIWMSLPEEPITGETTFYIPLPVGEYGNLTVGFLDETYSYCSDDTRKTYENVKVERCDMRTARFNSKDWEILFDRNGIKHGRTDGYDVVSFQNITGKWYYTYVMHLEFNGYGYNGDVMEVITAKAAANKASSSPKSYEGNKSFYFNPAFPAKQTVHLFAYQVDDEFNPTGVYLHRQVTPTEKPTCSEGYNKWLGTWLATGKDAAGNDSSYVLTITNKSNDELYDITGWAHSTAKLQGWYDAATGGLIIRTYVNTYTSKQNSSTYSRTFDCRGGWFGITNNGYPQTANAILCTGAIDETGTTATLTGYQYYSDSPFVSMGYFWWTIELNPETGRPYTWWYSKKPETLMRFPVSLSKVEVD